MTLLFAFALAAPSVAATARRGAPLQPRVPLVKHAAGSSEEVLHAFSGTDGAYPYASVVDEKGVLYGTTSAGGPSYAIGNARGKSGIFVGYGEVFALTPTASGFAMSTVYGFLGYPTDGSSPNAGLVRDKTGAFYGTTEYGGVNGNGSVYKLTPNGSGGYTESLIYSFLGLKKKDGAFPLAGVLIDKNGNVFGTAQEGGISGASCSYGCGLVYELTPGTSGYTETVLYRFGKVDGHNPQGPVIEDKSGALYGTTFSGGSLGYGAVFKLTPGSPYTEALLYNFAGGSDGIGPTAGLVAGKNGILYGDTYIGGSTVCSGGCGTVYSLTPKGATYTEKVIYAFQGGNDGYSPYAGLLMAKKGMLYGTTQFGGGSGCQGVGCGTVFALAPSGSTFKESIVYSFGGASDGLDPSSPVVESKNAIYGTTYLGGGLTCFLDDAPCGTVFKIAL
jgi:uncharacterized repeat protein (TIGR03803 family)